jgi:hypothetical protein
MDDAKQARITADMKREWSDAGAEIEALRASVARLTAERDAVIRWSIKHTGWVGKDDGFDPDHWWARGENGTVRGAATAEAAVRRAAGLELEEEAPR